MQGPKGKRKKGNGESDVHLAAAPKAKKKK
jgi:hypothetical protein